MSALLDPWKPTAGDPFDLAKAGHLARRTGFGAGLVERTAHVRAGSAAALEAALGGRRYDAVEGLLDDAIAYQDLERIRAYRVWRLLTGGHRLQERVSYLWHGHFATSNRKVMDPAALARQMAVFDRLGLGTFDELVLGVARDPAMIRWLDNDTNVAGRPNENFARELFELFTLGLGAYTERDVQEAARAFTGWTVRDGRFHFDRRHHDGGPKEVLGERGRLGGEDVVRIAVSHPASARFVAATLLAFFVHPEPTDDEVEALAARYTAEGRHVGRTIDALVRSRLFFSARAYRSRIRSPIEFAVGLVRDLDARAAPADVARAATRLGEALLEPPSVEGWPGHRRWLDPTAWRGRASLASRLFEGEGGHLRPDANAILGDGEPERRVDRALRLLVDGRVPEAARQQLVALAAGPAGRGVGGAAAILQGVLALPQAWVL